MIDRLSWELLEGWSFRTKIKFKLKKKNGKQNDKWIEKRKENQIKSNKIHNKKQTLNQMKKKLTLNKEYFRLVCCSQSLQLIVLNWLE